MRKAVIDVGSNSLLLLIEEQTQSGWRFVFESTAVTALGEGTKRTGLLSEPGVSSSLSALREMFAKARELGAESVQAGATMAVRIASNAQEFLDKAEGQGTPVFIVTGEQEAQLGFRAVAQDPMFAKHDRLSIIDPGGHSTELVTAERRGEDWDVLFRRSYSVGTLGLRSAVLPDEKPDFAAILKASAFIDDQIGLGYLPDKAGHTVVLGATGTNLVSIRDRLTTWQPEKVHGAWLDYEEVSKAVGWLSSMTDAERAAVPGMEKGRERTIHIGALILERFLYAIKVLGCSVSVRGWRYALLEEGMPDIDACPLAEKTPSA